jgi:uncharacterized protein (UPF0335 family)
MAKKRGSNSGGVAGDGLRSIVDRVVRLEEEKKGLTADIKEILQEAKSAGFDPKVVRRLVRFDMKTATERAREEDEAALYDIYRAAIGVLGDTPLGQAALKKLSPSQDEREGEDRPVPSVPTDADLTRARAEGAAAQKAGKPVLANPYPSLSSMRAAWDQGWCAAAGGDGMEIPPEFRRAPKPEKGEDDDETPGEAG